MKIAVVGGGSSYTPELVQGFLERRESLPLRELWLTDISRGRLDIVGGLSRRMVNAAGQPFTVHLATDRRAALEGARCVLTQLRVGGMAARRGDEYLGRRHGLIGQETTGVGGLAKALRTVPVILDIAREMAEIAPSALLLDFTNPAGLITEALARHAPGTQAVGLCNVAITTKMRLLAQYAERTGRIVDPRLARLDTLGLNHLSWHRGLSCGGEDLWPELFEAALEQAHAGGHPAWPEAYLRSLGMIPNDYLQYYYLTSRKLAEQEKWPPSRAEEVMRIEAELLRQYTDPALVAPPEGLHTRGGAYYSTLAAELINSLVNGLDEEHVVSTVHRGAVPGWPADWVLEMPARVGAAGIRPLPARPLPPACFGLLAAVKSFELLAVEAAVRGDRSALLQALVAHPLGPESDRAEEVMEDLLEVNRQWLPRFQGGT